MGSWNGNCAVSNIHITAGTRIAVFMLAQKTVNDIGYRCYTNTYFDYCPMPFYAEYNDYGAGENHSGIGLPIIMNGIENQLFEYEQGENQYHDIAVKKEGFNVEKMWEAAHESRLALNTSHRQIFLGSMLNSTSDPLEKADIAAKLAQINRYGRRIVPVMVHGDVFDYILDNVTREHYYYDENRNFKTRHYHFSELVADLPEFVLRLRCAVASEEYFMLERSMGDMYKDEDSSLVPRWLTYISHDVEFLFHLSNLLEQGCKELSDNDLVNILTEYLKGLWLNTFMDSVHKAWVPPMSAGQETDQKPYQMLNNAIQSALTKEREEWDEEYEEDESEEIS